jgi:hypothetical protein
MNNTFVTETDSHYVRQQSCRAVFPIFLVLSLVTCACFFVGWQLFIFFELIVIISCIHTFFQSRKKEHSWKLEFENDYLIVTDLTHQNRYEIYDIPASDFIINQTKKEVVLDYCSVTIKNTVFAFGGVKNCQQLKTYIQENYR